MKKPVKKNKNLNKEYGLDPFEVCKSQHIPQPTFTEEELHEAIKEANKENWAAARKFEALQYNSKMEFPQVFFPFP